MKLQHDDMDELIGKVLAGEATEQEQLQLNTWLAANPANQTYFDNLKIIFDKAASNDVKVEFDTDAAWNKVKNKIYFI